MIQFILTSIGVFLSVILLLVIILLVAKRYLSPSGNVNITVNGDRTLSVGQGNRMASSCLLHVAVRLRADNVRCRCSKVVAKFLIPRSLTSAVRKSKTIGA